MWLICSTQLQQYPRKKVVTRKIDDSRYYNGSNLNFCYLVPKYLKRLIINTRKSKILSNICYNTSPTSLLQFSGMTFLKPIRYVTYAEYDAGVFSSSTQITVLSNCIVRKLKHYFVVDTTTSRKKITLKQFFLEASVVRNDYRFL